MKPKTLEAYFEFKRISQWNGEMGAALLFDVKTKKSSAQFIGDSDAAQYIKASLAEWSHYCMLSNITVLDEP